MILSAAILAIVKLTTLTILAIFNVLQYINLYVHRQGNGLSKTRKAMLFLTTAFMVDTAYFLVGDFHELFLGVPRHEWFHQAEYVNIIVRILMLYSIWRLYSLLYDNH